MSSKGIIFIGILISALYIYFVIDNINISSQQELVQNQKQVEQPITIEPVVDLSTIEEIEILDINTTPKLEKKEEVVEIIKDNRISIPAFGFISTVNTNQIVALLSDNDKNGSLSQTIKQICEKQKCVKDLRYEKDVIDASWQESVSKIVKLIAAKKIKDGSLFIENNSLKIEGTLDDKNTTKELLDAIEKLKTTKLKIENYTTSILSKVEKPEIEVAQKKIIAILGTNPITFKKKSSKITDKSKKSLDQILTIINDLQYKELIISGHTDSKGNKSFNKRLSQKRADSVSRYLKQKGIKDNKIRSISFGSQQPNQKDSKDPKNRRVEILLIKGE